MNRKNTLIISLIIVVVLVGMGILLYFQSLKTVKFDVKRNDLAVKVEPSNATSEVARFTGSSDLRLAEGKYKAVAQNDLYDTTPIPFEVKGNDTKVTIDPSYSASHLTKLLQPEQAAINETITDAYPKVIGGFNLRSGQLYKEGQWYATLLVEKTPGRGVMPDVYRTVLKKEDGKWVIKAKPGLVLSAKQYTDIPFEILTHINSQDIYQ